MSKIAAVVAKQVRMLMKSPSYITRENNHTLWRRLGLPDPMDTLRSLLRRHLQSAEENVIELQSQHVQQWWDVLPAHFQALCFVPASSQEDQSALDVRAGTDSQAQVTTAPVPASLKEVTAVVDPVT